jgi:hypothetical protein
MLRPVVDGAELARPYPPLELLPDLREASLAQAPVKRRRQDRPATLDRRALEEMLAGIRDCHLRGLHGTTK